MAPHSPQDYFPATLGVRERWSTIAAVVLGVIVLFAVGVGGVVKTGDVRWLFISLPVMLLLFALGSFAPTGYRLAPDGVRVERRARNVVIPYRHIRAVDRGPRSVVGISMFGSQGVFGRFGSFWNMRLGFYRLYLTNRTTIVWLATDRGWVGLSPDRPDEFAEKLRARTVNPASP